MSGRDNLLTDIDQGIWFADQSKSRRKNEMISDWLVNQEWLFPGESAIKVNVLVLEKRRDPLSTPKTREMSPWAKASPAKASLPEKLRNKERLHRPDTSASQIQQKATIFFSVSVSVGLPLSLSLYIYIYIYIYCIYYSYTSVFQ